jgi:N-acetylmuramoyl-L-alanine amidase
MRWLVGLTMLLLGTAVQSGTLQGIRLHEAPDATRVVFDTTAAIDYSVFTLENPDRVVIDLKATKPSPGFDPGVAALARERIEGLRGAARNGGYRVVIDTAAKLNPEAFTLKPIAPYGHRLVVDLFDEVRKDSQPRAAYAGKDRDVVIVIDAGHGGDDPGAIGPNRAQEKRVVMQLSQRIAQAINAKRGFKAELVRTGDYYIALQRRTEIARQKRADLFISVHADAFKSAKVQGASVYTLSDRGASSETAKWLAERENRSDLLGGVGEVSLSDKDPVLARVLLDLSMDANRSQSIEAGEAVLANLARVTKLHKRRVEQASFVVLKRPDIPSILIEAGFISNPVEARRLSQAEHQDNVARAIATGVEQFMRSNPPPGTLLASLGGEMRYTIVRGDTLSEIASRYGISAQSLKSRNGLSNDNIRVGQVILIPTGS